MRLRSEPNLLPYAVDEILRIRGPLVANRRITRTDGSSWLADGFLEGQWVRVPGAGDFKIAIIRGFNATNDETIEFTSTGALPALGTVTLTISRVAAFATFTSTNWYVPQSVVLVEDTAFAVPLVFTLSDGGRALLLDGSPLAVVRVTVSAALGLGAIAVAIGGALGRRLTRVERLAACSGGALLLLADLRTDLAGAALLASIVLAGMLRGRSAAA